jgi:hypothetical protein
MISIISTLIYPLYLISVKKLKEVFDGIGFRLAARRSRVVSYQI